MLGAGVVVALVLAGCSSPATSSGPNLPLVDLDEFNALLAESTQPVVVNVWASWCLPCRAEAPLLIEAFAEYGEQVAFIGLAYNDNQPGAREFLAEFDLPFPHYFDFDGVVLAEYGGLGVPRTYFFGPGGQLVTTHNGVLDGETLRFQIDELLSR